MSVPPVRDVEALLGRLSAWAERRGARLRPPASEEDLAAVEEAIGRPLDPALRAFWTRHDGLFLEGGTILLSARAALEEREPHIEEQRWLESRDRGARYFDPGWVPITNDGTSDALCVDHGETGRGRVLRFHHDGGEPEVVHASFTAFLAAFLDLRMT